MVGRLVYKNPDLAAMWEVEKVLAQVDVVLARLVHTAIFCERVVAAIAFRPLRLLVALVGPGT